jgi:UDP:flavonoid glycosyltransferase YjiC (YdhE family)
MRVLLSTYGSRGDVQPMAGLAVRLRALGAEVRVCVPPDEDFAELLARVSVPLVSAGSSVRAMVTGVVTGAVPRPAEYLPRRAAEVYAAQFETLAAAAEGCIADQPYWAGRVAGLGIGAAHNGPVPTTESLSAALRTALTPQTRARAAAVAGTTRADGAAVAATLLLDAVSRERPPATASSDRS